MVDTWGFITNNNRDINYYEISWDRQARVPCFQTYPQFGLYLRTRVFDS